MIQQLIEAGVEVVLCGQTQVHRGLRRDQLAPGVKVALSAMTALVSLQERDERDRGRAASPLVPAQDAILIDSTVMSIDAVLERVYAEAIARNLITDG